MKISISLSKRVGDWLAATAKCDDTNASVICEAALFTYMKVEHGERLRLQRELLLQRRPQTANSWRSHFWDALAEAFEVAEMAGGEQRYLMAPRPYRGFQVMFDAMHSLKPGSENEIVVFTDTAPPYTEKTVRLGHEWKFTAQESVFDAARTVAAWIRDNEHRLK